MGTLLLSSGSILANRFEVERAAGSGGMGTVYRARDRYSGDVVALKILHAERAAGGPDERDRFAREAQLLSELRHPGIVSYVAHGQTPGGQRFLAMEWLEGQDLEERLTRGPLPVRDCVRLLEQVAEALSIAHQRGIIHRDLKPSNLFLVGRDLSRVKILDFGIARRIAASQPMTRTGMVVGTPEYMAPEQARGIRELTPAVDLFSLGCVLYECLSGQPPFVADHIAAVLVRILFEEPTPIEHCRLGVPAQLSALLGRLLAKQPEQRVADAVALRAELRSLGELPESALAATLDGQKPKAKSFAEEEQSLFSIVLAAPAEEDLGLGATQSGNQAQLAAADRKSLLQALGGLGGSPDFLANGTLVVTVRTLGSAHDQATVAARAALLIKERWPDAVVSMATGRGTVRGRTAVGDVVELAARSLRSGNHPSHGEPTTGVLIDPLSAKLLDGRFAQTPRPEGSVLLYEERDVDASRLLLGKPTPCVGREAELNNLEGQLAACMEESEARAVLITAPPGVGKSRLRHEFVRRVEKRSEPVTLLMGRGDIMSAGAPYGILRTAIHKLCGIAGSEHLDTQRARLQMRIEKHLAAEDAERIVIFIGELCNLPFSDIGKPNLQAARQDPKLMRDSLRRALLDFLTAESAAAPVLLILDDLQWGDELTVLVLDEALRTLTEAPFFVLSFARPEVHEVFPKLWSSHKLQAVSLKGLSKKACERLIMQVLGNNVSSNAVARAVEQSAGNALFLEELIRSIVEGESEPKSETVMAMLQARLGRLDSDLRRTLRAAAVFGQTFWRGGVATLLGISATARELDDWLTALVDAELIQPRAQSRLMNQSEYGFRHALVREAVYSLLTTSDISTGHRLAGGFLNEAGETEHLLIAEHYRRGEVPSEAIPHYLRAARQMLQRVDLAGVLSCVDRAVYVGARGEDLGYLRALECETRYYQWDIQGGLGRGLEAVALLPEGSTAALDVTSFLIVLAQYANQPMILVDQMQRLSRIEPQRFAIDAFAKVSSTCVCLYATLGMRDMAGTLLDRAEQQIERYQDRPPGACGFVSYGTMMLNLLLEPNPFKAMEHGKKACSYFRKANLLLLELVARSAYGLTLMALGAADQAVATIREALTEAHRTNADQPVATAVVSLLDTLGEIGSDEVVAEAKTLAQDLLRPEQSNPVNQGLAHRTLGKLALDHGDSITAETEFRRAADLLAVAPMLRIQALSGLVLALLDRGQATEACSIAEDGIQAMTLFGSAGNSEVAMLLASSMAFHKVSNLEKAYSLLQETFAQIRLRADKITDPFWKNCYLTNNRYCVRAQSLAKQWGLGVEVR